jgi:hypothetical protein
LLLNGQVPPPKSLPEGRPWLHGVHYNIEADTNVKPYRPLRSKDCIPAESIPMLDRHRENADARARYSMHVSFPAGAVWDINTSVKLAGRDHRY